MLRCPPAGRMLTRAAGRAEVAWCARMRLGGACVRCLSSIEWTDLDRDPRRRDRRLPSERGKADGGGYGHEPDALASQRAAATTGNSISCVRVCKRQLYLSIIATYS